MYYMSRNCVLYCTEIIGTEMYWPYDEQNCDLYMGYSNTAYKNNAPSLNMLLTNRKRYISGMKLCKSG